MALVHLSLLAGVLLIGIPIAVHLAMRPQPVRHLFPALQFVRERQQTSQRRLKLKRFLLLLLRCLAIAVAAIALARPAVTQQQWSVWGAGGAAGIVATIAGVAAAVSFIQNRGRWLTIGLIVVAAILGVVTAIVLAMAMRGDVPTLLGDQEAPVSAIILVDSSPRMDYEFRNKSRLIEVQTIAERLIEKLPRESEVAILDTEGAEGVFSPDRSAATTVLEKLEVSGGARPLYEQIDQVLQLAKVAKHQRRELYVFTDMTHAAWNGNREDAWDEAAAKRLQDSLQESDLVVYLIDVGVDKPQNAGLGPPRIDTETLVRGGEVILEVPLRVVGESVTKTVELWVESAGNAIPQMQDGELSVPAMVRRGTAPVSASGESSGTARFSLAGLDEGVYHGEIRMLGDDSLVHDNTRYFTIRVREAWPILLVAPENVSATFVAQSLAPSVLEEEGGWRFDCTTIAIRDLPNQDLSDYAAVCLLDPTPLPEPQWEDIQDFVKTGGGLVVLLGHNAQPPRAFQTPLVNDILGGSLDRQWRNVERNLFLAPQEYSHSIMVPFREIRTSTPWDRFPIFRHWSFEDLADDVEVLIRYGNGKEALIEHGVGAGKVLTLTSPLSDPARPVGRTPWNELAFGEDGWPQFILINEMVNYIVSDAKGQLNYPTGSPVTLDGERGNDVQRYQLFPPGQDPYQLIAQDNRVTLRDTRQAGNYRLRGRRGIDVIRGISANLESHQTALPRMPSENLNAIFGESRYQLVRENAEIERAQGRNRVGREFYPVLMVMLAMVVVLEQLLANRFYTPRAARE
jgi:hypothetical protein